MEIKEFRVTDASNLCVESVERIAKRIRERGIKIGTTTKTFPITQYTDQLAYIVFERQKAKIFGIIPFYKKEILFLLEEWDFPEIYCAVFNEKVLDIVQEEMKILGVTIGASKINIAKHF